MSICISREGRWSTFARLGAFAPAAVLFLALAATTVAAQEGDLIDLGPASPDGDVVINLCETTPVNQIVEGELTSLSIDDPLDAYSGGWMVVGGTPIRIPRNLVWFLPANWQTLQQLFVNAPPGCQAFGETGLATGDLCLSGVGGSNVLVIANVAPNWTVIAGEIFLDKVGAPTGVAVTGVVTFVDHTDGYVRVNGVPGNPLSGTMVRINDPDAVHTIQQGLGCLPGAPNNCSPDVRFTNDPENYTVVFSTGYPACIPSTVARNFQYDSNLDGLMENLVAQSDVTGLGDFLCPDINRNPNVIEAADSRRYAPIQVGDSISADGSFETVAGQLFFSAHSLVVFDAIGTRIEPSQPDYMIFDEAELDIAGYQNERVRALLIGFTTHGSSSLDIWGLNGDENNVMHEVPMASTVGNPDNVCQGIPPGGAGVPVDPLNCPIAGGGGIFKFFYDVDFIVGVTKAHRSPCTVLFNAGLRASGFCSIAEEFSILAPAVREVQGRTRHSTTLLPGVTTVNIRGEAWTNGQYLTPIGIGHAEFVEVNLDLINTPFIFAGEPWLLDRRQGPNGCQDDGSGLGTAGDGIPDCDLGPRGAAQFALDPFPFSGLHPSTQVSNFPIGAEDKPLAHWPFGPLDVFAWPPPNLPGPINCDDGNPCTDDSCDVNLGCVHVANVGVVCDDGDACTLNDTCSAGICAGTPMDCLDADVCNGSEFCVAGACVPGTPLNCGDLNVCTTDTCDALAGCVNTNNTVACEDGDACTANDVCNGLGVCVGGAPPVCNDGNPCTDDSCDSVLGCIGTPNLAVCDDGDACTSNDSCDGAGNCVGGGPTDCNDNNACTDDFCNSATGCVNAPNIAPCSDGNACTVGDQCAGSLCVSGAPLNCDDGDLCTQDSCDTGVGCVNTFTGGLCEDGNPCTDDVCDAVLGCVSTPNLAPCDDGNACTTGESCSAGACIGGVAPSCDDGDVCTDDSCDPALGCVHANNSAACDDLNACTTVDLCAAGTCTGSGAPNCTDGNLCTDDACDPFTGCTNIANTAACDDGDSCTAGDTCSAGACVGATVPPACGNGCLEAGEVCGEPGTATCGVGTLCGVTCTCDPQNCAVISLAGPTSLPATGGAVILDLSFNVGAIPLGSYSTTFNWDPAVIVLDSVAGGASVEFAAAPLCGTIDNVLGTVTCPAFNISSTVSPTGVVQVASLNFTVVNATAGSATVTATPDSISDTGGFPIPECNALADLTLVSGCGDVNGDGTVNIVDALLTAQFQVGLRDCSTITRFDLCDINPVPGDGSCNIADALKMAQCSVGLIPCDFVCSPLTCIVPPGAGMTIDLGTAVAAAVVGQADVSISLPTGNPAPGDIITGEVVIDTGSPLGAYGMDIDCDPTIMEILPPILGGTTAEFSGSPIHNVLGCHASLSAFQFINTTGPLGPVSVAFVDFRVLPAALPGSTSIVDLTTNTMADTAINPIIAVDTDSTVTVGGGCGNSVLELGEQCDDGNTFGGDCCSANCQLEIGSCEDGNACTVGDSCQSGSCVGGAAPDCNDSNPCTDDICNTVTGCTNTNNSLSCDDSDACTSGDTCTAGVCASGAALDCNDGNICTADSCDSGLGCVNIPSNLACDDGNGCTDDSCDSITGCLNSPNSAPCDDADACTTLDQCFNGACVGSVPPNCDDGNLCTNDSCDQAQGCVHGPNSLPCDDGVNCTVNDVCSAGVCLSGPPPNCDDGNVCTDDSCDEATGACQSFPNSGACDDGNTCTTVDGCFGGNCVGSVPLGCDDGNLCTDDSCDPLSGCFSTPNTVACDDGNACTTLDACFGGVCLGGLAPVCGDGNLCTDDSCDSAVGCVSVANTSPCDDADACTTNDICLNGSCVGGPAPNCADGNVCTDDSCNPQTGCVSSANAASCNDGNACTAGDVCFGGNCLGGPAPNCDDGNVCTDDSCDPVLGCVSVPNVVACDDNDACTTNDSCSGSACVGGPAPNCDDGNVCTAGSCDPATGCVQNDIAAPCDDGNACTTNDVCSLGACVPGAPLNCDDANVCTNDSCDPASGCLHGNNTASCDDGNACTVGDLCGVGQCLSGSSLGCDDGNVCTTDTCDLNSGCVSTNNSLPCDDGDACTTNDSCVSGSCVGGPALSCDDINVCTADLCDSAVGCLHFDIAVPCDDGNACTVGDGCSAGQCVGGVGPNCDDGNPCTDDSCDLQSGCQNVANLAPCDDGNACTTNDTCFGGVCVGGAPPSCDDGNLCTADTCDQITGCVNTPNILPCDDVNACTTNDRCSNGSCVGGAPPNCDDGNVCTTDSCNSATGCVNANNTALCDDGSACTVGDVCSAGQCVSGVAPDCDDVNVCTTDTCDPSSGCVSTPNSVPCNDGNACTTNDTCAGGICLGGPAPDCNDGNVCTNDSCDVGLGCQNLANNSPCDDGDACTTNDSCAGGFCVGGAPPNCDDGNVCTDDSCDVAQGCVNTDNTAPCSDGSACTLNDSCSAGACIGGQAPNCDDGNLCTDDSCDVGVGCVNVTNSVPCDDGDACTTTDTCANGACVPGPAPDCNDGNLCTTDSCDLSFGCLNQNNTVPCDDGDACTTNDTCGFGACAGGPPLPCDDANVCTADLCDSAVGCLHFDIAVPCDDGDACTTSDLCSGGQCVGGVGPNCNDGNVCTDDTCDAQGGCINVPNSAPCDDGNACTTNDTCGNGVCVGGPPPNCDDGNVCTTDVCDQVTGCVNVSNTLSCDDGDACTTVDRCSNGACVGEAPPNCNDGNVCTDDSCDAQAGCVNAANVVSCDDGDACTTNDACSVGGCVGGPPPNCDDGNVCTDEVCDSALGCVLSDNTASCDDGNPTSVGDQCSAGVCVAGTFACPAVPVAGCRQPLVEGKAKLILKNNLTDTRDRMVWVWKKGTATTAAELGDPVSGATAYVMCVYDEVAGVPQLVMSNLVPAGSGWRSNSKGFTYKDKLGLAGGITGVRMKAGVDGRAAMKVKAKGANLGIASLPLQLDSKASVQLISTENICWQADYVAPAVKNNTSLFKGKSSF